jgi:hypothetical protein
VKNPHGNGRGPPKYQLSRRFAGRFESLKGKGMRTQHSINKSLNVAQGITREKRTSSRAIEKTQLSRFVEELGVGDLSNEPVE